MKEEKQYKKIQPPSFTNTKQRDLITAFSLHFLYSQESIKTCKKINTLILTISIQLTLLKNLLSGLDQYSRSIFSNFQALDLHSGYAVRFHFDK